MKAEAEAEGLDRVFREAGFEWRDAGCSMCLAMNDDILQPGERCLVEPQLRGPPGQGGRTHLVSPDGGRRRRSPGTWSNVRTFDADVARVS